jgi:hypothetical protein
MTIRYCNLRKKKSTYCGIIEKENLGATQARASMQAELEGDGDWNKEMT